MIKALLVDTELQSVETLSRHLSDYCPQIKVEGVAFNHEKARQLIDAFHPELVFITSEVAERLKRFLLSHASTHFETIFVEDACEPVQALSLHPPQAYLSKPVTVKELIRVVQWASERIAHRLIQQECLNALHELLLQNAPNNLIAIPVRKNTEFLQVGEIIRCEGMQKYTRIIPIEGSAIVSSYNIGVFGKLFAPYHFFSPHKSHLINLRHIRRMTSENLILMRDGSYVPVSRRRKASLLNEIRHVEGTQNKNTRTNHP